jgi:hypothetical protein
MRRPIMCPIFHNIGRTNETKVLTGEKSLIENIERGGRMILKWITKTWKVCEKKY